MNPCVLLRKKCGINQKDFAAKYGFHKTTMVYWDAGMYPEISNRMNNSLALECAEKGVDAVGELLVAYGEKTLAKAYAKWQHQTRLEQRDRFASVRVRPRKASDKTPFYWFILDSTGSLQSFCKTLLVPASTTSRYSSGTTTVMPEVIEKALGQVGYPHIEGLRAAQNQWLKEH